MNIKKHSSSKKIIVAISVVLFCALILAYAFYIKKSAPAFTPVYTPTADEQRQADAANNLGKKQLIESEGTSQSNGNNTAPSLRDSITLAAEKGSDSTVTVLTKLGTFGSGTCELTIINGAKKYTRSVEIMYQPDFSSCAGFSIPVSDLGTGEWNINLLVKSGTQSASKEIIFDVD